MYVVIYQRGDNCYLLKVKHALLPYKSYMTFILTLAFLAQSSMLRWVLMKIFYFPLLKGLGANLNWCAKFGLVGSLSQVIGSST